MAKAIAVEDTTIKDMFGLYPDGYMVLKDENGYIVIIDPELIINQTNDENFITKLIAVVGYQTNG